MPDPYTPSPNVAALRESATIAVSARARALRAQGRPVIDLGAGEPDAPTPPFVCDAAAEAVANGATRYTAVEGLPALRAVIAAEAVERSGGRLALDAGNVTVSTGTKQSLFNACFSLLGPGDELLVPTPGWTSYYEIAGLARARAVAVRGEEARSLKVTPAALAAAATAQTRALVLNSPCNPTGAVYDAAELRAILDLARARGWWVIADEIYRHIAYGGGPAPSALEVATPEDRLVVVDGVAKAYAMTGWRIGWAIAPSGVARAMTALQSHTTSNAATVSQYAALAALTRREESGRAIAAMLEQLAARRAGAMAILRDAGVPFIEPAGAFYLFLRVPGDPAAEPGSAFAARLLEEREVAIVPGAAFGTPEWVRISFAAPTDQVLEGVRRTVGLLREWV
ncbi:MAG TPA: pyridoxal phosphate-dependent aminotransferase [Gemmatimonadaceae bacterium]